VQAVVGGNTDAATVTYLADRAGRHLVRRRQGADGPAEDKSGERLRSRWSLTICWAGLAGWRA